MNNIKQKRQLSKLTSAIAVLLTILETQFAFAGRVCFWNSHTSPKTDDNTSAEIRIFRETVNGQNVTHFLYCDINSIRVPTCSSMGNSSGYTDARLRSMQTTSTAVNVGHAVAYSIVGGAIGYVGAAAAGLFPAAVGHGAVVAIPYATALTGTAPFIIDHMNDLNRGNSIASVPGETLQPSAQNPQGRMSSCLVLRGLMRHELRDTLGHAAQYRNALRVTLGDGQQPPQGGGPRCGRDQFGTNICEDPISDPRRPYNSGTPSAVVPR